MALAAEMEALLARHEFEPRPDCVWSDGEDALGAVATEAGLFVGWVDVAWPHSHTPLHRLAAVRHLPPEEAESALDEEMTELRRLRDAALLGCRYCEQRVLPGHMHSHDICQGCAERHLGVVH